MNSISITNSEDFPIIGSAEAAVKSCVNLIAGMCGKPDQIMHYWLDLYYQVRLAYEQESAGSGAIKAADRAVQARPREQADEGEDDGAEPSAPP